MPAHANRRSTRDTVAGLQGCCQEQAEWFKPHRTEDWQVISLNHLAEYLKLILEITWE